VLEESIAGIEGIDFVTLDQPPERSLHHGALQTGSRDPTSHGERRARPRQPRARALPDEIDEPVIAKVEADAQPVIFGAFSATGITRWRLTDFADRYVKDRLQTLPASPRCASSASALCHAGLGRSGSRSPPTTVTPQDVEDALRAQNVEVPAGRIESQRNREFTVLSETDLTTVEQFGDLIVKEARRLSRSGCATSATSRSGPVDERRASLRFTGNAIAVGVVKQATANPLDISHGVRSELPAILERPARRHAARRSPTTARSSSRRSIDRRSTRRSLEAVVLVVMVIFLFLRSLRATLIPLVTIPVALIGAFALMFALGFTLNTLTLLSMVLAIGLVVDDAIVMLENIFRHVEEGMPPMQAAFKGSREIGFAVVAMTLTLVAVYAPIGFMTGTYGQAVHRVRLDARRRGARLGLRRADALADDVRQAAEAPDQAQRVLQRPRERLRGLDQRLSRAPAFGACGRGRWSC
jgi:multidrug efflux pump